MPRNGNLPPMVEGAMLEYYDGYLYTAGGQATSSEDRYPNGFYRYSLSLNSWEDITNSTRTYTSRYYTGSVVVNGYFYLMPGWNSEIGADVTDYVRVNLNSQYFEWESFATINTYSRDSFGTALRDSEIYIFGGYDENTGGYINSLVKLDLSTQEFTEISADFIAPSARSSHSMCLINAQLYIFGGKINEKYLNDMWVLDIVEETWSTINVLGMIPTARSDFASDSEGDAMVIWGGKDNSGLNSELFMFNALTNTWTQLISKSINAPSDTKGACMILQVPYVYIYGGITNAGFSGELWRYDLGTNEYSLLSTDTELAYATCQIANNEFYVILGYTDGITPQSTVRKCDLTTYKWETFYTHDYTDSDSAQGAQFLIGNSVIRIGGQAWGFDPYNEVHVFSGESSTDLGSIGEYPYQLGFVYFNTSLYCFGGGSVIGSLLRSDVPHNRLFKIDLNDICRNDLCPILCSKGTYKGNQWCEVCPAGSYAENIGNSWCSLCAVGTYNSNKGSTLQRQCYPCADGTYTDQQGSYRCVQCPNGLLCPIGTRFPVSILDSYDQNSIQPKLYSEADQSDNMLIFELAVGIIVCFILIFLVCCEKGREKIKLFDIFKEEHSSSLENYEEEDPTTFGGAFSILFIIAAVIIFVTTIVAYQYNNIFESKSLIPLVVLSEEVTDFTANTLTIYSSFIRYGDTCVVDGLCSPQISLTTENIRSSSSHYTCDLTSTETCNVNFTCNNCIIDTGARLSIVLSQQLSYATGIQVNITSDSSLPNQPSSIYSKISPNTNYMFIGSEPTEFYFTLTTSLFTSESKKWPSRSTGYHISTESSPLLGSQHLSVELPTASQLKLIVHLDKSNSSLYTQRTFYTSTILLLSGLIGSIFGIKEAFGGIMKFTENRGNSITKGINKKNKLKKLKSQRQKIKDFLFENTDLDSETPKKSLTASSIFVKTYKINPIDDSFEA